MGSSPADAARPKRRSDPAVLAVVAAYLALAAVGARDWASAPLLGNLLYAALGVLTLAQCVRTARRAPALRERLAWGLLATALALRFVGGLSWVLVVQPAAAPDPHWLRALQLGYFPLALAAMLLFPSARRRGRDAIRARLDVATVVLGSALLVWYLAIGPLLRLPSLSEAPLEDRLFALGDSAALLLAGILHLRTGDVAVRRAAAWLLAAYFARLVPDLVIWRGFGVADFSPFALVDLAWFGVWALHWVAAREAEREWTSGRVDRRSGRYRSSIVPHLFLAGALAVLLAALGTGERSEALLFSVGSAALMLLLVWRQSVEFAERDRLTQRLEWERARFRALLHHAYDAVALFGRRGDLRYVSPSTLRIFGDDLALVGNEGLLERVHPDDRAAIVAAFAQEAPAIEDAPRADDAPPGTGITGSAPAQRVRVRARDRQGRWRTFEGQITDHRRDPRVGGIVLHGIDRSREDRLAEGIEDSQPLEALGVLAGGLAHDLNNILTVVASHAELLALEGGLDARARADVEAIGAASDRAQALTRGLLTLSRRKAAGGALVDVAAVARAALAGAAGRVEVAAAPATLVRGDADALGQVVAALVDETRASAPAAPLLVRIALQELDDEAAAARRVEPRVFVTLTVGEGPTDAPVTGVEEAVRTAATDEWDLPPGDLALLIALAACRELGGTIVRERRGARSHLVALLPAVHQ